MLIDSVLLECTAICMSCWVRLCLLVRDLHECGRFDLVLVVEELEWDVLEVVLMR